MAMNPPFVYWGGTFRYPEHFQLRDGVSWQRGLHAFRFGGDIRFYRFNNRRDVGANPQGSGDQRVSQRPVQRRRGAVYRR